MLSVAVEDLGEVVVLHCLGRLVRGDETVLLCTAVHNLGREIVLDLAEVEAIDAAGVGVLISLQAAGVYLKLANPTRQVRDVLRVTGLESVFEISEGPWPVLSSQSETSAPRSSCVLCDGAGV